MKLVVAGYGRHGKDTVCDILRDKYGMTYESSSHVFLDIFFDMMSPILGYEDLEEAYEDRDNHRNLWFELIKAYNHNDKTNLGTKIFESYDIYCGIRNVEELDGLKDRFDDLAVVWVDASKRLDVEPQTSCTVSYKDADVILDNNEDLEMLEKNVDCLYKEFITPLLDKES